MAIRKTSKKSVKKVREHEVDFKATDLLASEKLVKLRLPDAGGKVGVVYLRPLMAADALDLASANNDNGTPNHPHQFMAICVVDKNGNRIFKDHEQIRSMRLDHYNQILGALLPIINPSAAEVLVGKANEAAGSDLPIV